MQKNFCEVKYDQIVNWSIPRQNIETQLLGTKTKTGLLFLNVESSGKINFTNRDDTCKIKQNQKICDKTMKSNLEYKKGNKDSVMTPLSIVNFHTHPLDCYIVEKCVWGWPSAGESELDENEEIDKNIVPTRPLPESQLFGNSNIPINPEDNKQSTDNVINNIPTQDIKNKVLFKDAMEKKIKSNEQESDSDQSDNEDLQNLSESESEEEEN